MFTTYYDNPDLIQYHVTRPSVPIIDTDGEGTFNISPIGFPVRNVSGELGVNPTLIIPEFSIGYVDVTEGNTSIVANYTNFNANVEELSGFQSFSETLTSITFAATTATATSVNKHGYTTGLTVVISGATDPLYNGSFTITVVDDFNFTYTMLGTPTAPAVGLPKSTFTLSPTFANLILEGQTDPDTNGFYTSSEGPWAILITEGQLYEPIVAYSVTNIDLGVAGTPYTITHDIQEITGNGTTVTVTTVKENGYQTGSSVTITGGTSFDGTYTITSVTLSSFTFTDATVATEAIGTASYDVQENQLVNLVEQTEPTENGIYRALNAGWEFWGCFYTWDGTENDNVEGVYPSQIDPITGETLQPNHYRRGYSSEEVNDWLRSQLETSIEFAKFRGVDKSNNRQGALVQWLLSGRRVNIGGQGVNKQVFVDGFGLGNPSATNATERSGGDVDTSKFSEVLNARLKLSRYNKQALWGLTNHASHTLMGATETSPYVKDYPFVYNSEYVESQGIASGGFISINEDVERWIMSTPGSATSNLARPLDQTILYYFRDNSYHNNITLDMNKDETFGRHNLVVNHMLENQDAIPIIKQVFEPTDVNTTTNEIEVQSGAQFSVGDVVWFLKSGGSTLPDGLTEKTTYYIVSVSSDDIQVSTTMGGAAVNLGPGTGSGINIITRLAFAPYTNYELKGYLDDLVDNSGFTTGIQIIKRKVDGDVTSYYFGQRLKESLVDIIPSGGGWAPDTLTYDAPSADSIRIYLESTETDYVDFTDPNKTTAELLQSLKDHNNLIPLAFDDTTTDVSELQQIFVYTDVVDYTDPVNNTAKIRSKKTFVHLPTPVELDDGTPFDLDVSVLTIPDSNPFQYGTVGSLSGYRNFVTQPRVYVMSGVQELDLENIAIDSLTQADGVAKLTTVSNVDIYGSLFDNTDVLVASDQIKVIEEYRKGEEIIIAQGDSGTLPSGLTDGQVYVVSSSAAYRITLEDTLGNPVAITNTGSGENWIIRRAGIILCVGGAEQEEYNGRFTGIVVGRNSFEYSVDAGTVTPATGSIVLEQVVRAEGSVGTKGLTERRNEALFGSTPENQFADDENVYHQTFSSDDILGLNMDKRVLLATVYPTNTSTFAWRIDNDPQVRMLQWSLLNVNAGGGNADTGSFANVAYKRNVEIVTEFGQSFFNFSIYANPLSYNTALSPSETQQQLAGFLRVLLPEKLAPQNDSEKLSDEYFNTVGSYCHQGAEGLSDLMADFVNGRVRVNSRDDNSGFQTDAKAFQHGYDGNHGSINIPTSFFDQTAGQEFIAYNTTQLPNATASNAYRWITKGLYTPDYIVNAEGNTALPLTDSYASTSAAFKTYMSFYFVSGAERETNAGDRYVPGELKPVTDPNWEFSVDNTQKFIKFLLDNNQSSSLIDDVRRRFWDSYYTIPSGEDRQIQNIYQINNTDSVLDVVKFHGMHWLPFARVFSADYEAPPEINIVDVDDYGTITGGGYSNVAATLGKSLSSNPIGQRFYEDGYEEAFVSANTNNPNNADLEEFLRNYINGYSNLMPYRFYNNFRTIVSGDTNVTANSTNTALNEVSTEMDVDRIYKFSTRDYLEQYGDTPPSTEIGRFIDDNFTLNENNLDGTNVVAEDYNPVWMYFENGNPNTDSTNSTIKNLIVVSGQNYLADREFYREKMLYNYTRIKIKFVFSRRLGRWMTLDYRQVATSFLTPTIGAVAFDETEKSVIVSGKTENKLDNYVQTILPEVNTIFAVNQLVEDGGVFDRVTFIKDDNIPVYTVGEDVMIYVPQDVTELNSAQEVSRNVFTQIASYVTITPVGGGKFAHTVEVNDVLNDFVGLEFVRIASQNDTVAATTYPLNNVTQLTNRDFIWNRDRCQDSDAVFKQLETTPYYLMEPNELNRGVMPYLSPSFPYDANGDRVPELNPDVDSAGAENYRLQRLLEPQKDSPTGINYVLPNNIHGGLMDPDDNLFLFQPHTWRTYWHIRPCASCIDGTDIPARNAYSGGVMADPVLNNMFYWPDPRNIQYAVPWHKNMTQSWFDGGFLIVDADRNTFDGCTSIIIDAVIDGDPNRPDYDEYDADRFSLNP